MTYLKHIFSVLRWLSLDVVVGGIIFTKAVALVARVDLHWSISAALGCCIWLIYTLDHLIDGNSLDKKPSTGRHSFHKKYRTPIFLLFLIVSGFGLRLLFYLPYSTLIYGCVLLGFVGLYFLSIWLFRIYFAKEIFIAVLYSCGIFLGVFSIGPQLDITIYFLFVQTILLASINLLLFSYYEISTDIQDGYRSWTTHFGIPKTLKHLRWLFSFLGVSIIGAFFFSQSFVQMYFQVIFIAMAVTLGLIYAKPLWFKEKERFRWIGDAIFILPGMIYWF